MPYSIELPDGTFIDDIPDEVTPEQAKRQILKAIPELGANEDRSFLEAGTDILAGLGVGAGSLLQIPGQIGQLAGIYGPEEGDTGLQGLGKRLEQFSQEAKSAALAGREAERARAIAASAGEFEKLGTYLKETATDPALLVNFFAEQVPNLVGSMGGGILTKAGVKLLMKETTEQTLARAGVGGAVGTGAVMQGADVGADTYERIYKRLEEEGVDPETANEQALTQARKAALSASAISVGSAFLPGGTTIERALVGKGLPGVGGFTRGFLGEAGSEATEETGGRLVSNLAMYELFPDTDITEGLGEAAATGILAGGLFGGPAGALSGRASRQQQEELEKRVKAQEEILQQQQEEQRRIDQTIEDQAAIEQFVGGYRETPEMQPISIPGIQTPQTGLTQADFISDPAEVRRQKQLQAVQQFPDLAPQVQPQPPAPTPMAFPTTGIPTQPPVAPEVMARLEAERLAKQNQAGMTMEGLTPLQAPSPAPMQMAPVTPSQAPIRAVPPPPTQPTQLTDLDRPRIEAINTQAEDRRVTMERLRFQAENDPTEKGRQIARQTLGQMLQTPAQPRIVALEPMDLRTATGRLNVLKSQLPSSDLNVIPHPSVPDAFAIEERPVAPVEPVEMPSPPRDIPRVEASKRIREAAESAPVQDIREQARLELIDRTVQAVEANDGIASPEQADILGQARIKGVVKKVDPILSTEVVRAIRTIKNRGNIASPVEDQLLREAGARERGFVNYTVDESIGPPVAEVMPEGISTTRAPVDVPVPPNRLSPQMLQGRGADFRAPEAIEGQRQALQQETEQRAIAAPQVDSVIGALSTPAFNRTAEEVSTVRIAQQRYAPEDVRLMEQAATKPDSLTPEGAQRLERIRQFGPRFSLSDQVNPEIAPVAQEARKKLVPQLKRFGLGDVALKLVDTLEGGRANGSYAKQTITLALDSDNPLGVMRHESIHALKELGAFTPAEWKVLSKRAKDEWVDRFISPEMQTLYKQQYLQDNNGSETGFQEYIAEEAIAEAFKFFEDTKPPSGMIQNLMRRLGEMFKRIREFFVGRDLKAENVFLSNQIFRDIEQGRMTRRGAIEERAPAFSIRSPLEEYVSPEEAEGRIRRREAREPGTGAPTNPRNVFKAKGVDFPVGKITKEDWLNRVRSLMSEDEIQDSRVWYQQLNDALTPLFGNQAPEYALAWLLSQKRASPTKGLLDVLRASDVAKGKKRLIGAGLNEQALIDVLSGRMPEGGVGAKLLDFVDSELGLPARTVVRGDPRGRQPAAIDVWAQRDIGFIDNTVLEFIKKKFGEKAAEKVQVDKTTSGEAQYEYGIDFYNDVVDMLNAMNYMGGGWTAREVQAVGWVTMQRAMGIQAEFVRDIIGGNTRRISIGLAPGEGSVMAGKLMGKEIPPMAAKRVVTELAELANVRVRKNIAGVGAYLTYTEGSIQVDALASPEAVSDLMDMIGYVFQQTEVINTRPLKSGKNMAIDIISPKLKSVNDATKFFAEFLNLVPKDKDGDPIAPGFQQIEVDGQPGIRLLNFAGKWRAKQVEDINQAIKQASQNANIDVNDVVVNNVDMKTTKNDWSKDHDGISYLDSLRNRGRLQEAELLQRRYPPSRFDLEGDGTIGWGGQRYSLRPDQLAFRPSDSGRTGIAFNDRQPDAKSFTGSHYGNARVESLSAAKYGSGLKGAEARRLDQSFDDRIRKRVYFYIPQTNNQMPVRESGVGNFVYSQKFDNILAPGETMSRLYKQANGDSNDFESAVIDAGYDGYAVPDYGMMVILNNDVPVQYEGTAYEVIAKQQDPANVPRYSLRTKPEPQKTVTAYKLFRVDENRPGELFPLFIDANTPVPIGKWMDADMGEGYAFQAENGHFYIPSTEYETVNERTGKREKRKTGAGIKIPNEQVRQELIDRGFLPKGSKATQIVALARRPGWHAGDLPMSTHLGSKSPGSQVVDTRSANQVWAEVEMPADVDWQSEARKRGMNKAGKFIAKNADITDEMPVDGFYKYKTSPTMTGSWMIGGSMKVNRILSDTEVAAINEKAGVKDLPRAKPFEAEKYGLGSKKYSLRPEAKQVVNTEPFKRWFRKSKIVNADGTPKIMYHGTARDITEFKPKQANAIFVTESPRFAESFTEMSEQYMAGEYYDTLSPAQQEKIIKEAIKSKKAEYARMRKEQEISQKDFTMLKERLDFVAENMKNKGYPREFGNVPGMLEDQILEATQDILPSRANIVPLYVRAERPFDYANPDHVAEIARVGGLNEGALYHIEMGSWSAIEDPDVQEAIRDAGFDGFYVLEAGQKNLAVYNPNQVKSATGNIGTFDETGRIRYNLTEKPANAPPQILTKTTSKVNAGKAIQDAAKGAVEAYNDNEYWTKKRIEWVDKDSGLTQRLKELPIFQADGTLRADMAKHSQRQVINLIKTGLVSGVPYVNTDGTVSIRRTENNLARSEILADQLNTHPDVVASGLTGKNYVAEVARALRGADILAEDARLRDLGVQQLEKAKEIYKQVKQVGKTGNMKLAKAMLREVAQLRKAGYANKKMNREIQVTPEQIAWAKKQLQNVPQVQEVLDIWKSVNNSLVDLYEKTGILSAEKAQEYRDNRFYVPLFKAREDLDIDMFKLAGVGAKTTPGKQKKLKGADIERNIWENLETQYAKMTASAYENQTRRMAVQQMVGLGAAEETNISDPRGNLKFRRDGQDVNVIVENPNVLMAFQTFSYELSPIMKAMGAVTNVLRAGALINPMFWIRQLIRDPIHASLVANSGIVTPFHAAGNFAKVIANASPEARLLAERGVIGQVDSTVSLNDFLKDVGRDKAQNPNVIQRALHKLLQVHEASDAATRVSVFKNAKEKALKDGMSEEQAIDFAVYKAREAINFSVMGMHPFLNSARQMIPFLNATIVGLDTLYKAVTGYGLNPEERREAMRQFRIKAGVMIALSAAYAMMYQDDDEYKRLPDYIKDNNFLIPIGTGEDRSFIKLAIPYEVGFLFKTVPEVAIRYLSGTSTGKEMLASYWSGLLHNLPTGGTPIPQAVRPALEVITNYSFFTGRPIESMGVQGYTTGYRDRGASEFAKMVSKLGLDKFNLSPIEIDYLMQGYFAELGTFGTEMASIAIAAAQGKEPPSKNLYEQPFFRSFLTNPNSSKAVADFYEISNNAQETVSTFRELAKVGNREEAMEMIAEPETKNLMAISGNLRRIRDNMSKVRGMMRVVENSDLLTPEQKQEQLNNLKQRFNLLAEKGLEISQKYGIE